MSTLELWESIYEFVNRMDACSTNTEYQEGYYDAQYEVNSMLQDLKSLLH